MRVPCVLYRTCRNFINGITIRDYRDYINKVWTKPIELYVTFTFRQNVPKGTIQLFCYVYSVSSYTLSLPD